MTAPKVPPVAPWATAADGVQARLAAFDAGNSHGVTHTQGARSFHAYPLRPGERIARLFFGGTSNFFLGVGQRWGAQNHPLGVHRLVTRARARLCGMAPGNEADLAPLSRSFRDRSRQHKCRAFSPRPQCENRDITGTYGTAIKAYVIDFTSCSAKPCSTFRPLLGLCKSGSGTLGIWDGQQEAHFARRGPIETTAFAAALMAAQVSLLCRQVR
jgi:hypothetical protein